MRFSIFRYIPERDAKPDDDVQLQRALIGAR